MTLRLQAKAKRRTAGGHGPPKGAPRNYKAGPPFPQSAFSPSRSVNQQTVTFALRNTHTLGRSQEVSSSDIRSPSMLQLSHPHTTPRETTATGNTTPSPGNRSSRIPVRSKAGGRSGRGSQAGGRGSHITKPTQIVQHNTSRPTQPPPDQGHVTYARPVSPPVPTVAKRLRLQEQQTMSPRGSHGTITRGGHDTMARAGHDVKPGSPPVPTLARKAKHPGDTFTKLPNISSPPAGGVKARSPPIPTLTKRNVPSSDHTHLPPLVTSEGAPVHKQGVILHELSKLRKVRKCGLL